MAVPLRAMSALLPETSKCILAMKSHRGSKTVGVAPRGGSKARRRRVGERESLLMTCRSDDVNVALTDEAHFITVEEIQDAAEARGLTLSMSTIGPFFRVLCRRRRLLGPDKRSDDADVDKDILCDATGFFAPWFGILHLDMLRVFNSRIKEKPKVESLDRQPSVQSPFGVGLLVGSMAVRYAYDIGCTKAELLAINDNNEWHPRLVKYYSRLGFQSVREVGENGLSDFPHLVVWGGAGTRMDGDISLLLDRWSYALRRSSK